MEKFFPQNQLCPSQLLYAPTRCCRVKAKSTKIGLREKLQRVPVLQMSNQESCVTNFFKEKNKDPWNVFVCGSSLQSI